MASNSSSILDISTASQPAQQPPPKTLEFLVKKLSKNLSAKADQLETWSNTSSISDIAPQPSAPWYKSHPQPSSPTGILYNTIAWTHDYPPKVKTITRIRGLHNHYTEEPHIITVPCYMMIGYLKRGWIEYLPNENDFNPTKPLDVRALELIDKSNDLSQLEMSFILLPHNRN